jgi:hypothetical protein
MKVDSKEPPLDPILSWLDPVHIPVCFLRGKDSVRNAKKTLHFTIKKINWLTLNKEIIAVYSENHTKPINIFCVKKCRVTEC